MTIKQLIYSARITALASCLSLTACAGSAPIADMPRIAPDTMPLPPVDLAAPPEQAPVIRPDDKISVSVAREAGLSVDGVKVAEDGGFDFPYLGRVQAAGRTTIEIAADIRGQLAQSYLVDPRVSVNVVDYASHSVTVEGSVARPGIFNYAKGTTLMGAIALAQGPTRVAKLNQIAIFRSEAGERKVAVFDLKLVRAGRLPDPLLMPGDRVMVGFSGLTQGWLDFLQTAPVIGIFDRIRTR